MIDVLVLSVNDGSDMRLQKTLKSLTQDYNVAYLGFGDYVKVQNVEYIKGFRAYKNPINLLFFITKAIYIMNIRFVKNIWIVDEELAMIFRPLMSRKKNYILDIYDSYFLKKNLVDNRAKKIQTILHSKFNHIIVTDDNRLKLLPSMSRMRAIVIQNFPNRIEIPHNLIKNGPIKLAFVGTLSKERGGEIVSKIVAHNPSLEVIIAGWLKDDYMRQVISNDSVSYLGIISQKGLNKLLLESKVLILCCYPPTNLNNLNASPNKIWDAVLTNNFVAINEECYASELVKENRLGFTYSYDDFSVEEFNVNMQNLNFSGKKSRSEYTWESQEEKLKNLCR